MGPCSLYGCACLLTGLLGRVALKIWNLSLRLRRALGACGLCRRLSCRLGRSRSCLSCFGLVLLLGLSTPPEESATFGLLWLRSCVLRMGGIGRYDLILSWCWGLFGGRKASNLIERERGGGAIGVIPRSSLLKSVLAHCTYALLCGEKGDFARRVTPRTRGLALDSLHDRRTMTSALRVSINYTCEA